ncbi:ComF family protein [Agrococcus jejuensis]|uniref:Predicted amidophosphoribosyltransferases n=1 Tax=Agrococcus jejuensis TaxID=399736 RepID=A0A1G8B676_9MICO|nr:phosphoribosyltransferase family protein [Agrococcus jejuensis]SDH28686.1 Predicted amidophosphoribosyltransferases [Agrococcus jejuensis]
MHQAIREALGVLWPRECAGCGAPDHGVCGACAAAFGATHVEHRGGVQVAWAATYDGAARAVVLAAKEEGRGSATRLLAATLRRLVDEVASAEPDTPLAVLVPASREGTRRRGFVPVRVLACRAGMRWIELAQVADGQQKRQGREARLHRAALRVRTRDAPRIDGARVVVIDDVATTGATLREAVAGARAAGAHVVAAVVVARVPRHG